MKFKPYIQMWRGSGQTRNIPIEDAYIDLETTQDNNIRVVAIHGFNRIWTGTNSPSVAVSSLIASSVEEFWLKASAAGYIHGEDSENPLFSEPEKENIRLRAKVAALENVLEKAKNLAANIANVIEKQ